MEQKSSFVVSPVKQEIELLKPGDIYEGSILVTNPVDSTEDFQFTVSASPFSVSGTDYKPDFLTMSDWSKITEWISFETSGGVLKPNESKRINYVIKVPKDAPSGGQYAMITISSKSDSAAKTSEIRNIYRMGSLIYAKVDGETVHQGQIIDNHVPSFVTSGTPTAIVTVSNEGNVHETLTVNLKVKNVIGGQEVSLTGEETDIYDSIIMPSSTRVISRNLEGLPGLGIFEVTQDVSYIGQTSNFSTVLLVCPIWFMILVILTIMAVILTITYKIVSRRKKNLKKQLHFNSANDKIDS